MSENKDMQPLKDLIRELAIGDVGGHEHAAQEAARKRRAELFDAEGHLNVARERRADTIESVKDGEPIDPAVLDHLGDIAIEAGMRLTELRQSASEAPPKSS